jgi:holo-[acyl-carrier protein] synthase
MYIHPRYLSNLNFLIKNIVNKNMIKGHGIDITTVSRFMEMDDLKLLAFAKRILTEKEYKIFADLQFARKIYYLTKIWSAKEAIAKAFGTGVRDEVVWQNIEILNDDLGAPKVNFKNALDSTNLTCFLSISHEGEYIMSSAIITDAH